MHRAPRIDYADERRAPMALVARNYQEDSPELISNPRALCYRASEIREWNNNRRLLKCGSSVQE
jgi:hypothetical protein